MTTGPIHLHIADVLTAVPAQIGVEAGLVKLTEDEAPYRSLRIIIGQTEARAISAGWHGAVPGRPSTWDLFVSTIALLGGRIDRVVITAVHEERHYYAHLEIEHEGERRILACRPSDALALAVRAYNVDILAEPSVLDAAGVLPDGTKPGRSPDGAPSDPDAQIADREAALAAREAELAARERALLARERAGGEASLTARASDADTPDPGFPGIPDVPLAPSQGTPDEPLPPELPTIPSRPEIPATPLPPEIPATPLPPEVPGMPLPPDVPATPRPHEVPATPPPPEMPSTPLPPEVPGTPHTPEAPATPRPQEKAATPPPAGPTGS